MLHVKSSCSFDNGTVLETHRNPPVEDVHKFRTVIPPPATGETFFLKNSNNLNFSVSNFDGHSLLGFMHVVTVGQGHFVTSHLGDNMASVTWATKVSTKWVDQIDPLTDIFEGVTIFVVWLGRFAPFAK